MLPIVDLPPTPPAYIRRESGLIVPGAGLERAALPGFLPGLGMVASPVSALSYVNATAQGSGSSTNPLPAGCAAGDLAIFVDMRVNASSSLPTSVVPAGWMTAQNATGVAGGNRGTRSIISCKVLTSTDVAAGSITGMGASTALAVSGILCLRPTGLISSMVSGGHIFELTAANPDSITVAAPPARPAVLIGLAIGDGGLSPSGTFTAYGAAWTIGTHHAWYYDVQNVTLVSRNLDMGDTGAYNALHGLHLYVI